MNDLVRVAGLRVVAHTDSGDESAIVKEVSFSIPKGEVLALIGESGSGKTTIALALMGYARSGCRIAGGSVHIGDTDVRSLDSRQLSDLRGCRVAYIAQSAAASFNPAKPLMDQVIEPSAAVAFAAARASNLQGARVGLICSGGNTTR